MMNHYYVGIPAWKDARPIVLRLAILLGDMFVVGIAYSIAYQIRFYFGPFIRSFPVTKGIPPLSEYIKASPVILFMWVLAISWQGGYKRITMQAIDDAIRIGRGAFLGTILAMSAMFLYRETSYSRLVFMLGGFISYGFLYIYRELIKVSYLYWIHRNKRPHRVLILGNGYLSTALHNILKKQGDRAVLKRTHFELPLVKRTIIRSRIQEVLVANTKMDHKAAVELASFCEDKGVNFRLLPDVMEIRMGEVLVDESLGIPTIQLKPVSLHGTAYITKRAMDVILAGAFMGIFFVPLALLALLIKITSPGSVLYKHKRVGFRGREFDFLKFRTMVRNADDLLEVLRAKSDRQGPVFKMKSDPRVTAIGKFLRRYSIDEIPQLLNVLKGEMSLVGPRPQVIWEAKLYDDWAKKRLNVLPGITGLWQVSGRAELTYQEMIDLDIYYIERWSPGLDIKIMMKTLPAILVGKGAY